MPDDGRRSLLNSPKELLAHQRLLAYKIVTKGFVGKDECRINFEPHGFDVNALSVDWWMLC